jgi:zinc protease
LYPELLVKQAIATDVGAAFAGRMLDGTSFSVYASPRGKARLADVESAVDAQITRIARDGVTDSELEKAKARFVRSMIFARDKPSGMANIYGVTLTTGGTVEDVAAWPDRIRKVTADQIKAVAARYLVMDHATTGYLLPKTQAEN